MNSAVLPLLWSLSGDFKLPLLLLRIIRRVGSTLERLVARFPLRVTVRVSSHGRMRTRISPARENNSDASPLVTSDCDTGYRTGSAWTTACNGGNEFWLSLAAPGNPGRVGIAATSSKCPARSSESPLRDRWVHLNEKRDTGKRVAAGNPRRDIGRRSAGGVAG